MMHSEGMSSRQRRCPVLSTRRNSSGRYPGFVLATCCRTKGRLTTMHTCLDGCSWMTAGSGPTPHKS
eukprot:475690-Alexandrium_andersonii.AAC.1